MESFDTVGEPSSTSSSVEMDSLLSDENLDETNKLEITRNPFDSNLYDRDNFPALDESVFTHAKTPDQRSPAEFRWSIDQIAMLKPADLDMCPNQEYSVVYERKEDEEREQKKVDEYFKNVLLPSPWMENRHVDMLKRVTFSPHPPSTRYIQDNKTKDDNGDDSINSSIITNTNGVKVTTGNIGAQKHALYKKNVTTVEACCQTMLTLPMDFDLFALLGKEYFTYNDETYTCKEISVSSLRRKLFGQDNNTSEKLDTQDGNPENGELFVREQRSETTGNLKLARNEYNENTPRTRGQIEGTNVNKTNTPSYTTSSPSSKGSCSKSSLAGDDSSHMIGVQYGSISLSSNDDPLSKDSPFFLHTSQHVSPPKQASNVGTPAEKHLDISLSSVDVSPISSERGNQREIDPEGEGDFNTEEESNYSFLPSVSCDLDATEESVFESSRAVRFNSPGISPIKVEQCNEFTRSNTGVDSLEFRDSSSIQLQSIKESTARNIHAFSGLELSSIVESKSHISSNGDEEDKGPFEITELENEEQVGVDEEKRPPSNDGPELLDITDLQTTTEQLIEERNKDDSVETPKLPVPKLLSDTPESVFDEFVGTPLKGILKHRDIPQSGGSSSASTSDYEQDTKFNTKQNSGRARNRILQSLSGQQQNSPMNSPTRIRREIGGNSSNSSECFSKMVDGHEWKWSWRDSEVTEATFSDELVYRRALSALKRSRKLTGSLEREFFDKENLSPWKLRRKYQLNSTEVNQSNTNSFEGLAAGSSSGSSSGFMDARTDSGVASMSFEWTSQTPGEPNIVKTSTLRTPTERDTLSYHRKKIRSVVSPISRFSQLSIQSPWSQQKKSSNLRLSASSFLNRSYSSESNKSFQPSHRYLEKKSHSWPHHKRRVGISPSNQGNLPVNLRTPRPRVNPLNEYKQANDLLYNSKDITNAFKDFLPSPLK